MTNNRVHFAHVTDAHISEQGDPWETLGAMGPHLLQSAFDQINEIDDLDFVLLTGDMLDLATEEELEVFLEILSTLQKPWHFVPGNHDGFIHASNPVALRPQEVVAAIDPRLESPLPEANMSFWSRPVMPGVHLIGLDSRLANDWGGVINPAQLNWLSTELSRHDDDLILIAIHHPTHNLGLHNEREWWDKFILSNGAILERQLDMHPNVRMVVAGHHHANHISLRNGRMHLCTAAISGYPCVYRTVCMTQIGSGWDVVVDTHTVADERTLEDARAIMLESTSAQKFEPGYPEAWATFCLGRPEDQQFEDVLE